MRELYEMDEAKEQKPRLMLDARASKLQKLEGAVAGQKFKLAATAKVVEIKTAIGPDGMPVTMTCLELGGLTLDDPDLNMASVYPTMQGA